MPAPVVACRRLVAHRVGFEPVARTIDSESLLVEQVADAADQQYLMVLIVAPVAAPLYRLELREFLLPITQHVRLDRAKVAHLAYGEVALGGYRRKVGLSLPGLGHGSRLRPLPSVSDWREK